MEVFLMCERISCGEVAGMLQVGRRCSNAVAVFFAIALILAPLHANGQQARSPLDSDMSSKRSEPENIRVRNSLTANQIIALIDAKPEVAVGLKKLMADQLEQQGYQIQEDSITDEMLFSRIASDANLRGVITNWLRARGYINEKDMQKTSDNDSRDDNADNNTDNTSSIRSSISQAPLTAEQETASSDQLLRSARNLDSDPT